MATLMTNAPSYARAAAANAVSSSARSVNTKLTGASLSGGSGAANKALEFTNSALQTGMNNLYNGYAAGAAYANQASANAQAAQYAYNKNLMDFQNTQQEKLLQAQMDFSTQSAEKANKFTEEMWNKTAEFNAAQAQLQRDWDEKMASTAYQRTMADMKAAGLNPILAYMNGASSFGSGATASVGGVSSAQANTPGANAASGSVGNYTGQGFQVSDTLAIIGGVVGLISDLINSAKDSSALQKFESNNTKFWNEQYNAKSDKQKVNEGKMSEEEYEYKHGNATAANWPMLIKQYIHSIRN